MTINPIKTERDYQKAPKEIEKLRVFPAERVRAYEETGAASADDLN